MLYALLIAGAAVCAWQAIRASRLLVSALWLAGLSALVAVIMYRLGAQQVAVIELSVGAGLVTVLFVFAISIAGDDAMDAQPFVPVPLALGLILAFGALLAWMIMPVDNSAESVVEFSLESVLWGDRGLDVLVQIVLIFSGVLCLLGILQDEAASASQQTRPGTQTSTHSDSSHDEAPVSLAQMPDDKRAVEEVQV